MADIFSEVDEEVRREQAEALWKRYGNYVVAGVLLVLLGIAAYWGWQKYQTHRQIQAAESYIQAVRAEAKESAALLAAIAAERGGFGTLARLKLGSDAVSAGDLDKAKGIFAEIAADSSVEVALRGAAALKAALIELDAGNADAAKALVAPYDEEGNPYRLSAMEISALAALQTGEKAEARAIYERLKDLAEGLPVMATRAEQMIDRLAE